MTNFTVSHNSKRMLSMMQQATEYDGEKPTIAVMTTTLGYDAHIHFTRIEDLQQLVLQATGLLGQWQQEIEEEAS